MHYYGDDVPIPPPISHKMKIYFDEIVSGMSSRYLSGFRVCASKPGFTAQASAPKLP